MSDIEDVFGGSAEEETNPSSDTKPSDPQPDAESKTSVVTEQTEEVIPGGTEKMVTETIDEDGDVVEETTEVTRKTVKRTMKITEVSEKHH
ncbi:hypothetical protein KR018_004455 [Drosophila ironensis]|nr:hypothetical protein KR018_004455 [Drosophila ironensis]